MVIKVSNMSKNSVNGKWEGDEMHLPPYLNLTGNNDKQFHSERCKLGRRFLYQLVCHFSLYHDKLVTVSRGISAEMRAVESLG
jgi:hypothetical protein